MTSPLGEILGYDPFDPDSVPPVNGFRGRPEYESAVECGCPLQHVPAFDGACRGYTKQEREIRLAELRALGIERDKGNLRMPLTRYYDSANNFLRSLRDNPPTPEEILGKAAHFLTTHPSEHIPLILDP